MSGRRWTAARRLTFGVLAAQAVAGLVLTVGGCDYDTPPSDPRFTTTTPASTAAAVAAGGVTIADDPPQASTVQKVVDGDTFDIADGRRIRLIGIDTPESTFQHECGGKEATEALKALLPVGAKVTLTPDVTDRDRFGRLLRYAAVDGRDVGAQLLLSGWAEAKRYPPDVARADTYEQLEADARGLGRGMWGAC